MLNLIDEKKIEMDRDFVIKFDTLDVENNTTNPTVRESREISTYGIETSVDLKRLNNIKELIVKVQKETIKILQE